MTGLVTAVLLIMATAAAHAQSKPTPPPKPTPAQRPTTTPSPPERIGVRGFVTFGGFNAQAQESFEAIFGSNAGPVFGGGAHVLLPRGIYVELSASRFHRTGERVFVGPDDDVFRLGIPLEVTLTPLEITGGWRYRHCPRTARTRVAGCRPRVVPYVGGGFSSYRYEETSEFGDGDEDIAERFNGFHVLGGAEYLVWPWMAVGGELEWSSVADALAGGVAAAFNEGNLGGTTFRVKISIGR
jgi:opacity protein-like surface antigen